MTRQVEKQERGRFRSSDGMFTVTVDQKITTWNATAEKLLGRRQDQVLGKKCYEVMLAISGPGRIRCKRGCAVITNAVKGRTTRDFDLECRVADGSYRQINMSILLVGQAAGGHRVLHLFRDVTDRRRVERASSDHLPAISAPSKKTVGGLPTNGYRLPPLTTREDQVLRLLAAGKNTTDIADILEIRPLTARNHVSRLLSKLDVRSRLEAVALGTRAGLI